jgi:hypothetical protein
LFASGRLKFFALTCAAGCAGGTVLSYLLKGGGINAIVLTQAAAYALVAAVNIVVIKKN